MSRAALTLGSDAKAGVAAVGQAISLDDVRVELLRVGDGSDPDDWRVVESTRPAPDGSFAFSSVETGRYALRLSQPEFGGAGYGVDATDFTLGDGETVRLVLPLLSTIHVEAPGVSGSMSPDGAPVLDEATGRVHGVSGDGYWVLDPDAGTVHVLASRMLFKLHSARGAPGVNVLLPGRNAFLTIVQNRIVSVQLDIFGDEGTSEVLHYEDPDTREVIGERVRWRLLPERILEQLPAGVVLGAYPSRDNRTLYISLSNTPPWGTDNWQPGLGVTMVIDLDTLAVRRIIQGEARTYHPLTDQLVFHGPDGVLLVDASAIRDVASAPLAANLGVAPIPGVGQFMVAWSQINNEGAEIPFLARIDGEGNVLQEGRAAEVLGLGADPAAGAPSFDREGEVFMLGPQGYRVLPGGGFEAIGVQVPPGLAFQERVACNRRRVFDPVNRYELWYDCGTNEDGRDAMAILSADRGNIPVSVRVNGAQMVVDPIRGRAIFLTWGANASIVHYADPTAAARPANLDIQVDPAALQPGPACSDTEPCPSDQVCVGRTDTAFSGNCQPNRRAPWRVRCGGLTQVPCDDGYTCALSNPTNPQSTGVCEGDLHRDYESHGILCEDGSCPDGFFCHAEGRCVPRGCRSDAECEPGEVCGLVAGTGRVCVSSGPWPDGALCTQPTDCAGGACVPTGFMPSAPSGLADGESLPFNVCATGCFANRDCADGQDCVAGRELWPVCVDRVGPFGPEDLAACTVTCAPHEVCQGSRCATGVWPAPVRTDTHGECAVDVDCPVPAQCLRGPSISTRCGFWCNRNRDCPWDAECFEGTCLANHLGPGDPMARYRCADETGCDDHQQCIEVWFFGQENPRFCVDEDPCVDDGDCAAGESCVGICAPDCQALDGLSADDCPQGWQCVHRDQSFNWSPHHCLPPVCDCPPAGNRNVSCSLEPTPICSFRQPCAYAPCDGTFGPDNPDPEASGSCCAPGNPCGLSGPELCQCPPSCDWWRPDDCPDRFDGMPETGGAALCPTGWSCAATAERPYGWRCRAAPRGD